MHSQSAMTTIKNFTKCLPKNIKFTNNLLLFCIIGIVSLLNMVPILLRKDSTEDGGSHMDSLQPCSYKGALIASMTATFPIVLDLILDVFSGLNQNSSSNLSPPREMFLSVILVDLLLMFFLVPWKLETALVGIFNCRDTFIIAGFLIYINKSAPYQFNGLSLGICGICLSVANLLDSFSYHYQTEGFTKNLDSIYYGLIGLPILIFIILTFNWIQYLRSFKYEELPKEASMCNFYLIFFFIHITVDWVLVTFIPNFATNYQWQTTGLYYLTVYTYTLVVTVVAFKVFTRHLIKKEKNFASHSLDTRKAFMRYISHEIRTPLNIVMAGLKVLEEDMQRGVSLTEQMETLLDIRGSCVVAIDTLSEVLTYDKVESKKMTLDVTRFRLLKFIQDALRPFYLQSTASGVDLNVVLEPNTQSADLFLNADGHKLSQVFRNLVSNALKFTPTGGTVTVLVSHGDRKALFRKKTTSFHEGGSHSGNLKRKDSGRIYVKIEVTDTGAGISTENQKKLFKDVVQFNPGKLQAGGGTGLGLYISKGIVDLHKGELTVYSAGEGTGTTFTLIIPMSVKPPEGALENRDQISRRISFFSRPYASDTMVQRFRLRRVNTKIHMNLDTGTDEDPIFSTKLLDKIRQSLELSYRSSFLSSFRHSQPDPEEPNSKILLKRRSDSHVADGSTTEIIERKKILEISSKRRKSIEVSVSRRKSDSMVADVAQEKKSLRRQNSDGKDEGDEGSLDMQLQSLAKQKPSGKIKSSSYSDISSMMPKSTGSSVRTTIGPVDQNRERSYFEHKSTDFDSSQKSSSKTEVPLGHSEKSHRSTVRNEDFVQLTVVNEQPESEQRVVRNVLIVDDSEMNRKMLKRLMRGRCESCDIAIDGKDAFDRIQMGLRDDRTKLYDVILMDFEMPRMNGPEATRAIRDLGYMGLILGLTGNSGEEEINLFLAHGADKVLVKPLDIDKYDAIVSQMLKEREE